MICHKNKLIFIHISKCAGTSIERALLQQKLSVNIPNYEFLYGWDPKAELFLHHATPKQLMELGLLDRKTWDTYFKFIIVRNPWDRAYSDYLWMLNQLKQYDTFNNFLNRAGVFKNIMTIKNRYYRGDHLNKQIDYFFIDGQAIKYDKVLYFENLKHELPELANVIGVEAHFFMKKENVSKSNKLHYSQFYNVSQKKMIDDMYSDDIQYLGYMYEKKPGSWFKKKVFLPYHFGVKQSVKMYFNYLKNSYIQK